ncbi:putative Ig domain-containing protein, partial [Accumulibacter sp.]|uniref:putative Ig domain-containing protein n=1 Tax=Accumulibacter sp. TaxID=2053492 RepID=UPI00262AB7A0
DAARGVFSGTPQNGDVGSLAIRVRATDRAGATVAADFTLAVDNVNDAPLASTPLASQSARSGSAFRYQLPAAAFIDVDAGDRLLLSASLDGGGALPGWLRFDAPTATFSGTPSGGAANYDISVTASDLAGATSSQRFALSVSGGNAIPVANPDTAAVIEDRRPSAFGNVLANDRDDDGRTPLRVSDAGTRRGTYGMLMLLDNGVYRYLLDNLSSRVQALGAGERAVDRFSYRSSDGQDFSVGELSVTVSGTNDVPSLQNPLPDLSLARNSRVRWQIPADSFADRDASDTLAFSASQVNGTALPSWLRFDAATRTFSGYVPANAQGDLAIVVTASDGHGANSSVADTFNIRFTNAAGHSHGGGGNACAMPPPGPRHHQGAGNSDDHPDSRGGRQGDDRQSDWERAWGVGAWAGDDGGQRRGLAYLDRDSLRSFVDSSRAGGNDDRQPSGSRVQDDFFERWTAMDRTLNRLLQESDRAGSWPDAGHAGEALRFAGLAQSGANPMRGGVDPVSLPGSGEPFLRSFRGLQEGVDRIV